MSLKSRRVLGTATPIYAMSQQACSVLKKEVDAKFLEVFDTMVEKASASADERKDLHELLIEFRHILALDGKRLGVTHLVEHEINTGEAKPISKAPFRTPIAHRKLVQEEIEKMLSEKVISPSRSPWAAPLFPVKKKDNTWITP